MHVVQQAYAETGRAPVLLAAIQWVLMQQICVTRSYFVLDTNTNFLFREDHEQLRYEDYVLAQALIQVQQGLENIWPKHLQELENEVIELLVETENFGQQERG
jgi:hypothetical protein